MSALRNDSDKQGIGEVLNHIIYQNTLEMMHVQGGKAHKKDLCKGGKMQSAFFWRFALPARAADGSQCHTCSTCGSCLGPHARPGSHGHCRPLHSSSKTPAASGSVSESQSWSKARQWQGHENRGKVQLVHPAPACPVHRSLSLWCTQQLLNWGRQCWAGSWGRARKGTLGTSWWQPTVPVPALPHPAAATAHQEHPCTAAPGHQGLQEPILKPTQLPGHVLVNKPCKVSASITMCYPKPEPFDIKHSFFTRYGAFLWFQCKLYIFKVRGFFHPPQELHSFGFTTSLCFSWKFKNPINQPSHPELSALDLSWPREEIMQETKAHLSKPCVALKQAPFPRMTKTIFADSITQCKCGGEHTWNGSPAPAWAITSAGKKNYEFVQSHLAALDILQGI